MLADDPRAVLRASAPPREIFFRPLARAGSLRLPRFEPQPRGTVNLVNLVNFPRNTVNLVNFARDVVRNSR
jgi:hypothetical protein